MKIVSIANFNLLKTENCSQNSMQVKIANGLIRAGHQVICLSDRDLCRLMGITGSMNFWGKKKWNAYLLDFCKAVRPDAIFLGHADTVEMQTLLEIKKVLPDVKILDWNVDNITQVHGADARLNEDAVFTVEKLQKKSAAVDMVFVTTGDKKSLKQLKTATNSVAFFPNIVDTSVEKGQVFTQSTPLYDFFFAATARLKRQFCGTFQSVEDIAATILKEVPDLNPLFAGVAGMPKVHADAYQKACESCAMGFSLSHLNSVYLYQSDRFAHMIGNGELVFLDRASGYQDFFTDSEIAFYGDEAEFYEKLRYYKAHPKVRMQVARAGYEKAIRLFNEKLVAEYMLDLLMQGYADKAKYPWAIWI